MNETTVSVIGNVATPPVYREHPTGPVTRFRLAVTSRHRDRAKDAWVDGHTNFFTVWAWRRLGVNAAASLSVGEQVLVQGKLKVRSDDRGGQQWSSADIEAIAIGHDLSRGTSAFRRGEAHAGRAQEPLNGSATDRAAAAEPDFRVAPAAPQTSAGPEPQDAAAAAAAAPWEPAAVPWEPAVAT